MFTHTPMRRNPAKPITEEELTEIERRAVDYPDGAEILGLCREVRVLLSMSALREEQYGHMDKPSAMKRSWAPAARRHNAINTCNNDD